MPTPGHEPLQPDTLVLIILDPNPDIPRPRDYTREGNDLLAVRGALATNG